MEEKKEKQLITETYSLIMSILEIKKRGAQIIQIEDNNEKEYSEEEIMNLEKERVESLYQDKNNVVEIYNLAYHHFRSLFDKNMLYEEDYDNYIKQLDTIKKESKTREEFKAKVIILYLT